MDDLDFVALLQGGLGVLRPQGDFTVQGHRGELAPHLQVREQAVYREARGQLHRLAVDGDYHEETARLSRRVRSRGAPRRIPFAGITQCRFEGSRAAPGSQETSPSDAIRIIPQRRAGARAPPARSPGADTRSAGTRTRWAARPPSPDRPGAAGRLRPHRPPP